MHLLGKVSRFHRRKTVHTSLQVPLTPCNPVLFLPELQQHRLRNSAGSDIWKDPGKTLFFQIPLLAFLYESQVKLGFPVLAMRNLTLFLESPTFSRVSIEPGMEAAAPDLTETIRGGEPPKTFPVTPSMKRMPCLRRLGTSSGRYLEFLK